MAVDDHDGNDGTLGRRTSSGAPGNGHAAVRWRDGKFDAAVQRPVQGRFAVLDRTDTVPLHYPLLDSWSAGCGQSVPNLLANRPGPQNIERFVRVGIQAVRFLFVHGTGDDHTDTRTRGSPPDFLNDPP